MMTLKDILNGAIKKQSTDIHVCPGHPLMYRVNRELIPVSEERLSPEETEWLVMQVLNESQREQLQKTGEVDTAFSVSGLYRLRVNVFRQRGSYAIAIRILPERIPTTEELGIPEAITQLTRKKRGLILVTGAAGSGKSTTMASLIDFIAKEQRRNIITLEDPIEYLHNYQNSMVSQREIGSDCRTYAEALKATFQQDPDVVQIDEMTDLDTIAMALAAAEVGHLVISSLYSGDAVSAIDRLIEVFPAQQQAMIRMQLMNVLEGIMAQQLLPRLNAPGRVPVFEVMLSTPAIMEMIRGSKTNQIPSVMLASKALGMQAMDDAILDLYLKSKISSETAITFAQDPIAMTKKVTFL